MAEGPVSPDIAPRPETPGVARVTESPEGKNRSVVRNALTGTAKFLFPLAARANIIDKTSPSTGPRGLTLDMTLAATGDISRYIAFGMLQGTSLGPVEVIKPYLQGLLLSPNLFHLLRLDPLNPLKQYNFPDRHK